MKSWIRTTWRRTTETLLGISLETCLRHCGDVLMGRRYYVLLKRLPDVQIRRCGDVPLRCLENLPPKCRWVFNLICACDVAGTYRETSLRRFHDALLPGGSIFKWLNKKPLYLTKFRIS